MNLGGAYAWATGHPVVIGVALLWILVNLAPRPHPEDMSGYQKVFWGLVDRLAVLTAKELPGRWKWIFAQSPSSREPAELTQNDIKTDPPGPPPLPGSVPQDPPKEPPS
jgi:hypothetical protein